MADLEFSLSDTNSSLFSAIRSLETGSPTGNYGEVAGIAVGAYQFTSITLKQLGAVKRVGFPPKLNIKQNFVFPTIVDGLSCDETKSKTAFVVWYTPGCYSAACYSSELYGINGQMITHNGKGASRFYGVEARDQKLTKSISLRDAGDVK